MRQHSRPSAPRLRNTVVIARYSNRRCTTRGVCLERRSAASTEAQQAASRGLWGSSLLGRRAFEWLCCALRTEQRGSSMQHQARTQYQQQPAAQPRGRGRGSLAAQAGRERQLLRSGGGRAATPVGSRKVKGAAPSAAPSFPTTSSSFTPTPACTSRARSEPRFSLSVLLSPAHPPSPSLIGSSSRSPSPSSSSDRTRPHPLTPTRTLHLAAIGHCVVMAHSCR